MKKLNLLVDWSYMLHKSLSVYESVDASSGDPKLTTEADKALFARKIITDLCFGIRKFATITLDKVMLNIDSRSWRKDVVIPDKPQYKDNRKDRTSTVNWDGFYDVSDELILILEKFGFYISKVKAAEADDTMFLYANKFLKDEEDTIVLTGDKDLWQLVDFNPVSKNFSMIYVNNSKYSKIICTSDAIDYINEDRTKELTEQLLSALSANNLEMVESLSYREGIPLVELDPYKHAFLKIFTGDKGDDVPPLYEWEVKQKTRTVIGKFTEKRISKVWDLMDSKYEGFDKILKLHKEVDKIIPMLKAVSPTYDLDAETTIRKMQTNITLMLLHESILPQEVFDGFEEDYKKLHEHIDGVVQNFNPNQFRTPIILKGTRFEKEPNKATGFMRNVKDPKDSDFNDVSDEPMVQLF